MGLLMVLPTMHPPKAAGIKAAWNIVFWEARASKFPY
jgi:hypothetical protein